MKTGRLLCVVVSAGIILSAADKGAAALRLESAGMVVEVDDHTGNWSLLDKAAGVRWPSQGAATLGAGQALEGEVERVTPSGRSIRISKKSGVTVTFELVDDGRSLAISCAGKLVGEIRVLEDALGMTDAERGAVIVPCREGLLLPADSGVAFQQSFGTSEHEGCHMNMLGLLKADGALVVSWDDAYVCPEIQSTLSPGQTPRQRLSTAMLLGQSARSLRLTPLGKGDANTVAAGYRRIGEQKGLAVTLRQKIARQAHAEGLVGAANFKLWTCLERRMNEDSSKEESVKVHWTFDEAADIAEHLHKDLGIARCLFTLGGWTEGGYDCRHPDNLPANPECGGNEALARAIGRIQALGYVACLHDNYQDMYRNAKSWDPAMIEKRPDGSLITGGGWLGGRPYMVCAPKQYELAMRPQNLPETQKLFGPWSYFIDTTFAVGPRECADPNHPLDRNQDILWKCRLSDKAREIFGLFGSECGREWALPHSDFFEGIVGVYRNYFGSIEPAKLGAKVIPFWEMVYHDCQVCYGKYEYEADQAGEYVAHHVLCARPLHYHSIPDHRYWTDKPAEKKTTEPRACFTRTDNGWADGLHPTDAFLKTTHEVLGPLNKATAHQRLERLEFLSADGSLRRAVYGQGDAATTLVVNFGPGDVTAESPLGGQTVLPPYGFVVAGPRFAALYTKAFGGRQYPAGALFTLEVVEGNDLATAKRLRLFHGFGDATITWRGKDYEVRREQVIELAPDWRSRGGRDNRS